MFFYEKNCNILIITWQRFNTLFVSFLYFNQFTIIENQFKYSFASIVGYVDVDRFVFV